MGCAERTVLQDWGVLASAHSGQGPDSVGCEEGTVLQDASCGMDIISVYSVPLRSL